MNRKQTKVLTVLTLSAFVLGALVSREYYFRYDLSTGKSNTLSPVSRELYREITDQVTITYFRSNTLARSHPIPGAIEDLLREYVHHSRGRIRLVVQDPVEAGTAAAAELLGIVPRQIQTMESDQAGILTVYSGLVIEYLDRVEVLPLAISLGDLEFAITSRILSVARGRARELGVLMAASDKSWQEDFPFLAQRMVQAGYRIRLLSPGEEIPDTLPALLVFGGAEELDSWALYRLDRYLSLGGRILFSLEGVFVDSRSDLSARTVEDSGLLAMLRSYGVTVEQSMLLDAAALTIPYRYPGPTGVMQTQLMRYPHWPAIPVQQGNATHPIGASFAGIDLFWPSPLTLDPPSGVRAESLVLSTEKAWLMTDDFVTAPGMASAFGREAATTTGQYTLAAALIGIFPQYFADKPKPTRDGSTISLPELPPVSVEGRIVVIGDGDLASTLIQYTRSERNLDFLMNAVDWLSRDGSLAIPFRSSTLNRLDRIQDPERRYRTALFSRTLNTIFLPLSVVILGALRFLKRRGARKEKEGNSDL